MWVMRITLISVGNVLWASTALVISHSLTFRPGLYPPTPPPPVSYYSIPHTPITQHGHHRVEDAPVDRSGGPSDRASAGIGAAIAERLVKAGMVTIGCARNIQPIQELAEHLRAEQGKLFAIKCDLNKEEEIVAMFEVIKTKYGGIDVCINNAGLSHPAPLFSGAYTAWRNMLDVNVMGLAICSQEAFKSMKERAVDDGMIIHISSMSAHRVVPSKNGHFYSATKFAVRALLEGMRNELREMNSNIRVSEISPGLVETEFAYRMSGDEAARALYGSIDCLKAEDITDAVIYVMSAPQHVSIHDVLLRPTQQKS